MFVISFVTNSILIIYELYQTIIRMYFSWQFLYIIINIIILLLLLKVLNVYFPTFLLSYLRLTFIRFSIPLHVSTSILLYCRIFFVTLQKETLL